VQRLGRARDERSTDQPPPVVAEAALLVRSTIPAEESKVDADDLPDEMDAATSEHAHSPLLELRERDRSLPGKIEAALRRTL
jgi:hypothetical protein